MKKSVLLVLFIACLLFLPTKALAMGSDVVVTHDALNVPQQQVLQTLVVLSNDAKIEGRVTDVVFVYNGDVVLSSTSRTGIVVVLGGHVVQENGAQVEDGVAEVTFDHALLNSSLLAAAVVAGLWAARLFVTMLLVVIPVLAALALRERLEKQAEFLSRSAARTGAVGLVVVTGGLGVAALLALSLVGAPLALVLAVVLLLLFAFGYAVVAYHAGKLIAGNRAFGKGAWRPTLVGAVALAACSNVPFFGGILLLIVLALSVGISTVWLWQRRAKRASR